MRAWRRALALVAIAQVTLSIHTPAARSQEPDGSDARAASAGGTFPAGPRDAASRSAWLSREIEAAIVAQPDLAGARVGVAVTDLRSGASLYSRAGDDRFNVASNAKLVTTAAALDMLGPGFRYRTSFVVERLEPHGVVPGNLYVRGQGDPSLGTHEVQAVVDQLWRQGIKRIRGGIVIDDSYFDGVNTPPHFDEQKKSNAYYRAPIGAVSFNFNRVNIYVRPDSTGVGPAVIMLEPDSSYIKITSSVLTVESGRTRIHVRAKRTSRHFELAFTGQIHMNAGMRRFRYRVADPVQYLGTTLHRMLRRRGIRIGRTRIRAGKIPTRTRTLTWQVSPRLAVLVRGLGKFSNNYVAEMLLKTIGAEQVALGARPATWEDGLSAVRGWLRDKADLPDGRYRYDNGSGLFDATEFSPKQIVSVLAAAHNDFRFGAEFVSSLSIAGTDGTLRRRMRGTPAQGRVRGKTGTLARVSALSGFAAANSLRPLAFSVLIGDMPKRRRWRAKAAARALQDRIAALIAIAADGDT